LLCFFNVEKEYIYKILVNLFKSETKRNKI